MPHIHIRSFNPAALPTQSDRVRFDFMATNVEHADEHLIAAAMEEKEFFLLVKEGEEKSLLKSDKISRPSPNFYIKKALQAYAQLSGCEVLDSNVNDTSRSAHLATDSALRTIHDFARSFPSDREVRIEVGFGSGRHLLHQAKAHPNILFIGIEIHKPSIEQVLKQINIQGIGNLLLLDYDARLFLELVPSNIAGRIYVHFPVPWDKKPHRRVIGEAFVNEAIRVLKPGGKLELRTDSDNYFAYAFETFTALQKVDLQIFKNRDIAISSKYEDRWKRMEKNIYDITLTNEEESPPLNPKGSFVFAAKALSEEKIGSLNGKTIRFEGGFVHFERLYKTTDGRMMFRLSMGSFERPEHLYLIIGDDKAEYFPSPPVPSRTNFTAHSKLSELLYG
jgi:tRNA (guanine-N7-)-methyltransferase